MMTLLQFGCHCVTVILLLKKLKKLTIFRPLLSGRIEGARKGVSDAFGNALIFAYNNIYNKKEILVHGNF